MPNLKETCAEKFTTAMNNVLPSQPDVAQRILSEYGISRGMSDDEALPAVLDYINDICFFAPVLTLTRGWRGNSHVYYFNEGNPWEGPWKGRATHILDVAYLTQNFQEFMTPSQQRVATAFAEDFFKFCHGIHPWPAVTDGDIATNFTARVYGPSSEGHDSRLVSEPYKGESHRRSILFDCNHAVSLDELAGRHLRPSHVYTSTSHPPRIIATLLANKIFIATIELLYKPPLVEAITTSPRNDFMNIFPPDTHELNPDKLVES
ncbi:unnamed protein product [Aspergillus oryzae]|nr:unnamed protein product [Aspergillus oryzae]GMF83363.1 unnamed protein product [Aspergillus oryzae]